MIAEPAVEKAPNVVPSAGAAAGSEVAGQRSASSPPPISSSVASQPLGGRTPPKPIDPFDLTVERIREVFKGEIIP